MRMLKCRRNEIKQFSQKMIVFLLLFSPLYFFFFLAESILLPLFVDTPAVEDLFPILRNIKY